MFLYETFLLECLSGFRHVYVFYFVHFQYIAEELENGARNVDCNQWVTLDSIFHRVYESLVNDVLVF
jgi:hypothetical protein